MEETDPVGEERVSRRKYFLVTQLGRAVLMEESNRMSALLNEARQKGFDPSLAPGG